MTRSAASIFTIRSSRRRTLQQHLPTSSTSRWSTGGVMPRGNCSATSTPRGFLDCQPAAGGAARAPQENEDEAVMRIHPSIRPASERPASRSPCCSSSSATRREQPEYRIVRDTSKSWPARLPADRPHPRHQRGADLRGRVTDRPPDAESRRRFDPTGNPYIQPTS